MKLRFEFSPQLRQLMLFVLFFTMSLHTFAYGDNTPVGNNSKEKHTKTTTAREKVRTVIENIFKPVSEKNKNQAISSHPLLSKEKKKNRKNKGMSRLFSKRNKQTTQNNAQETDPAQVSDPAQVRAQQILELQAKLERANKLIDKINPFVQHELPIGIAKEIAGKKYTIVIENMVVKPEGVYVDASFAIKDVQSQKVLGFEIKNALLTEGGFAGDAKMQLIGDVPLNILGGKADMTIKGGDGTYVQIGCEGFEAMGVEGLIEFSRELIIPAPFDPADLTTKVTAGFAIDLAQGKGWDEMIIEITHFDPFTINKEGIKDFTFEASGIIFDKSGVSNSPNANFPPNYHDDSLEDLWEGFFLQHLSVTLPEKFETENGGQITFNINDLIIDRYGVSGEFSVDSLIGFDNGNLQGWQYSLDLLGIGLLKNQIVSGRANGELRIPIEQDGENTGFAYGCIIDDQGFKFSMSLTDTVEINAPILKAKMVIHPGSIVNIDVVEKKFKPSVKLNGVITINTKGSDETPIKFSDIEFHGLRIQNDNPCIDVEVFSFGVQMNNMNKFPIYIKELGIAKKGDKIGLHIAAGINLVGEGDGGFGADASLDVLGKLTYNSTNRKFKAQYVGIQIDSCSINANNGAFAVKGSLIIYKKHEVFGNGFKGMLDITIQPGINIKATMQFGKTLESHSQGSFRYFYADAHVISSAGAPILPGLGVYGFGGGIYFKMRMINPVLKRKLYGGQTETDGSEEPGVSLSGITYFPDNDIKIGIKAKIVLGTHPEPTSLNGSVGLEIAFNDNFGIATFALRGAIAFMHDIKKPVNDNAQVWGKLDIDFSRITIDGKIKSVLSGTIAAGVNMPGAIKGDGICQLYFSDDDWFVYIGDPWGKRIDLVYQTLLYKIKAGSYFCMGSKIPDIPPPSDKVVSYLTKQGIIPEDKYNSEQLNSLSDAKGISFGIMINAFDIHETLWNFYANAEFEAGADVMLTQASDDCICEGIGRPGINGWYAKGQAYGYLHGDVGIEVEFMGNNKRQDIFSITGGILLEAQLPKPFYLEGAVAGDYSILGGMVSGHCNFKMEFGQECKEVGPTSPLDGIEVIAEASPEEGATEVNVFADPQVAFNIKIGKDKQSDLDFGQNILKIIDDEKKTHSYRIILDHFTLKTADGVDIPGELIWNDDASVVAFRSPKVLPELQDITLDVKVSFEERINNTWSKAEDSDGGEVTETRLYTFTTGPEPEYIDPDNVKFTYPIANQLNFYPGEFAQGFIQLDKDVIKPFVLEPGWEAKGRFISSAGQEATFDYTYDRQNKRVNYTLPTLENGEIYKMLLVKAAPVTDVKVDDNVKEVKEVILEEEETDAVITTKDIEGLLEMGDDIKIFDLNMRVSKYGTLREKISNSNIKIGFGTNIVINTQAFKIKAAEIKDIELFDAYEFDLYNSKLIKFRSGTIHSNWYSDYIYPRIYTYYEDLKTLGIHLNRDVNALGVPPFESGYINQKPSSILLEETDSKGEKFFPNYAYLCNELDVLFYQDYYDLSVKCAEHLRSHPEYDGHLKDYMCNLTQKWNYPAYGLTDFYVNLKYYLPFTEKYGTQVLVPLDY